MLKLLSTLVGRPVISHRDGLRVADVSAVVGDASAGKVVAYQTNRGLVSTTDVMAYLDEGIIVPDAEAVRPEDELIRVKQLGDLRTCFIGLKVVTEQGKRLGTADDALIETDGHFLVRLHVQAPWPMRLLSAERVIPRERIVRMNSRQAVVRYDEKAPVSAEPEIAQ